MEHLRDFLAVVGASFGAVKETSTQVVDGYILFLRKAAVYSLGALVAGTVSFWLSDLLQAVLFNLIGVLLWAGVVLLWIIAAQPIAVLADALGSRFEPARKMIQTVMSAVLGIMVVSIATLNMPPGEAGREQLVPIVALTFAAALLGYHVVKQALVVKLVAVAAVAACGVYLPNTMSSLSSVVAKVDQDVFRTITPQPKEIELTLRNVRGQNNKLVDPFIGGKPQWHCRKDDDATAGYRCFDSEGRDSRTNEPLLPITPDLLVELEHKLLQAKKEAEVRAAQEAAERAEAQRLAALEEERLRVEQERAAAEAARAKKQAELEAYRRQYTNTLGERSQFGIAISDGRGVDAFVTGALARQLGSNQTKPILRDSAINDGVFDRLYSGDESEFRKLALGDQAERVILGRVRVQFAENRAIRGVTNANASIEIRVIDTDSALPVRENTFSTQALGYSESEARQKAIEELIDRSLADLTAGT